MFRAEPPFVRRKGGSAGGQELKDTRIAGRFRPRKWCVARHIGRRGRWYGPSSEGLVASENEDARLERDAGVQLHDLRKGAPVVDAEQAVDDSKDRVLLVEDAVSVAEVRELLLPDRELELAEVATGEVALGHHPDERVHRIDGAVDGPQPGGQRRPADADDGLI